MASSSLLLLTHLSEEELISTIVKQWQDEEDAELLHFLRKGIMNNKFKVTVGDWSNDGHGQSDTVYFTTNFSESDLQAAMLEAKRQLKQPFDDLFSDYEDSIIPLALVEELKSHGWELPYDCEEYDGRYSVICHDGMVRFFMSILQTFTENLEYNIVQDNIPEFSFPSSGYGLYC